MEAFPERLSKQTLTVNTGNNPVFTLLSLRNSI
jgi:hypothetical protein